MRLNKGLPPLGFVAPRIYQTALQHSGEAFEDILQGNSGTSCNNGFPATEGWDANTGFGRPIWGGLVKYLASDGAD
jgi:tripeptidyl-peptidase-1